MEPLFINNFTHSKEMYIEMNRAYSFVSRLIFQIAVAVIYGFLAVLLFFYYGNYFSGAAIVLVGVFLSSIRLSIHASTQKEKNSLPSFSVSCLQRRICFLTIICSQ